MQIWRCLGRRLVFTLFLLVQIYWYLAFFQISLAVGDAWPIFGIHSDHQSLPKFPTPNVKTIRILLKFWIWNSRGSRWNPFASQSQPLLLAYLHPTKKRASSELRHREKRYVMSGLRHVWIASLILIAKLRPIYLPLNHRLRTGCTYSTHPLLFTEPVHPLPPFLSSQS